MDYPEDLLGSREGSSENQHAPRKGRWSLGAKGGTRTPTEVNLQDPERDLEAQSIGVSCEESRQEAALSVLSGPIPVGLDQNAMTDALGAALDAWRESGNTVDLRLALLRLLIDLDSA